MIDEDVLDEYLVKDFADIPVDRRRRIYKPGGWSAWISLAQLQRLTMTPLGDRNRAARSWAMVILLVLNRETTLRYSSHREEGGWIRLSNRVLPGVEMPHAKTKAAAISFLERARLVEVKRTGHSSPRLRLLLSVPERI